MNDVTRILHSLKQGQAHAADELLPLIYEELRKLAAQKMANEAAGHTLQPTALVDDLFVRRPFRRAGLGTAALEEARTFCTSRGVRAMLVETGDDNVVAQAVYRRAGFVLTDRLHLTLRLADPTHVG